MPKNPRLVALHDIRLKLRAAKLNGRIVPSLLFRGELKIHGSTRPSDDSNVLAVLIADVAPDPHPVFPAQYESDERRPHECGQRRDAPKCML
jgi:hypothetical protein